MSDLIVFFNSHLNIGISGGDERALQILKNWNKMGMKISRIYTDPYILNIVKNRKLDIKKTIITTQKEGRWGILTYLKRTFGAIKSLKDVGDDSVFYSVSSFLPDVFPAMLYKKKNPNIRWFGIVQHVIEDYRKRPGNTIWNFFAWVEQRFCIRCMGKYSDGILAVNSEIKEYLIEIGIPENKIKQVANGFDDSEIKEEYSDKKIYDGIFVGRLVKEKGVYDLPEIWKKVCFNNKNAKLCIVGNGIGNELKEIQDIFISYGLEENVEFTGAISHREVIKKIYESKVLVFPSFTESWGLTITEAMACGVPCVTYDIPVFESIYKKINLEANLHDTNELSELVEKVLYDDKLANKLIEDGKKLVFNNYTWSKIAKREWEIVFND